MIKAQDTYKRAKCIGLFISMPHEIDTYGMIAQALSDGM